jgi:hypothetical protein
VVLPLALAYFSDQTNPIPILQMYNPLNPNLRHVIKIEQQICQDRESQQDCRCCHEQDGVQICSSSRLGRRNSNGLQYEVLHGY